MHLQTFFAALAALAVSTPLAFADAPKRAAQQCAIQTNAPGNYFISNAPGLPHVIRGWGGTDRGAALINDCLTDVYQVQYGAKDGDTTVAATAPATARSDAIIVGCSRSANGVITGGSRLCVAP